MSILFQQTYMKMQDTQEEYLMLNNKNIES